MERMKRKWTGAVLTAFGLGMLLAGLIPLWGLVAAAVILAVGIYMILYRDC